jgi:glycerophosphoryl diester phosphodiesterase
VLDRSAFIRPIAHRGFHDKSPSLHQGPIENTAAAFEAGLARGYGVECDLQPAADGTPMVFHDETVDRLMDGTGRVDHRSPADLKRLRYRDARETMLTFAEFLELAKGRGPLLVEIKSEWTPLPDAFLRSIAKQAIAYKGPLALMSFDPDVMTSMRGLAPGVPRGVVAGAYRSTPGDDWWSEALDAREQFLLRHLLRSWPAKMDFAAYHVKSLPTVATRLLRAYGLPLFTWTVRTPQDRAAAKLYADAPIFEGFEA